MGPDPRPGTGRALRRRVRSWLGRARAQEQPLSAQDETGSHASSPTAKPKFATPEFPLPSDRIDLDALASLENGSHGAEDASPSHVFGDSATFLATERQSIVETRRARRKNALKAPWWLWLLLLAAAGLAIGLTVLLARSNQHGWMSRAGTGQPAAFARRVATAQFLTATSSLTTCCECVSSWR